MCSLFFTCVFGYLGSNTERVVEVSRDRRCHLCLKEMSILRELDTSIVTLEICRSSCDEETYGDIHLDLMLHSGQHIHRLRCRDWGKVQLRLADFFGRILDDLGKNIEMF